MCLELSPGLFLVRARLIRLLIKKNAFDHPSHAVQVVLGITSLASVLLDKMLDTKNIRFAISLQNF